MDQEQAELARRGYLILRRIEKEATDGSLVGCLLESVPEHTCKPQKSSDPRKRGNNRETSVCVLVR